MITTEALYPIYLEHRVISTDSRKITDKCLFFALSGENFDGNEYALEAIEKGAAFAIVDDDTLPTHPQLLLVDDVLLTLQELAALHRLKLSTPVIAITGTNGKTTTKELTAAVLSTTFNILYTEGNLNNHIGVPLTLLRLREDHDFALIEMGASKPGDIDELCQIAQPNYGIITNIGEAHLEGFKSIVGVERTKGELFVWLREHEGKSIRKEDDERLERLSRGIPSVTYGTTQESVIQGYLRQQSDSIFLEFSWSAPSINISPQEQKTQLVGNYNLDNALVAISIGLFFGVDTNKIRKAIANYQPNNIRSQLIETSRNNTLIADAYNANPSSMKTAILNFISISSNKQKLMILGDMNELGQASIDGHQVIYDIIQDYKKSGGKILFCGPIWSDLLRNLEELTFPNVVDLSSYIKSNQELAKHLILVKGSNGVKLDQILPLL